MNAPQEGLPTQKDPPDATAATVSLAVTGQIAAESQAITRSIRDRTPATTLPPSLNFPQVQNYEVLGILGRGGMGVVYKARHLTLNRLVALKMILGGEQAGTAELARFRAEAQAVAHLEHPNIVQIYEIGAHQGQPFIALELVEGGSLKERLKGTPLPAQQAALLAESLARAMHFAHERGVVHRDLKPSNILVSGGLVSGEWSQDSAPHAPLTTHQIKITDFGLAKKLDTDSALTQTGAIVGTPSYMAPEQARGTSKEIGPLADVYAIGAILYESLTGSPPFRGATVLDTLEQVRGSEPVPPSRLQLKVPRDLETICLKCLQKEPRKRYASAADLAADLRRFQAGEPVLARPVSRLERGWRWCRRNPVVAGLTALMLSMLIAGFIASTITAVAYSTLAEKEKNARTEAQDREQREIHTGTELRRTLSTQYVANGARSLEVQDHGTALVWFAKALELDKDDPERSAAHRLRLANTWRQTPRLVGVYRHDAPLTSAEMSPDGKRVVTAGCDGTARIWDVATGAQVGPNLQHQGYVFAACFSPDSRTIATASGDGSVRIWDAASGALKMPRFEHANSVCTVVFSPDGTKVAAGCYNPFSYWSPPPGVAAYGEEHAVSKNRPGKPFAAIWDLATQKHVTLPVGGALALAFNRDGQRLVIAAPNADGALIVDSSDGKVLHGPFKHSGANQTVGYVVHVALSPDEKRLLTGTYDKSFHLWDLETGKKVNGKGLAGPTAFFAADERVIGLGTWTAKDAEPLATAPSKLWGVHDFHAGAQTELALIREKEGFRVWNTRAWKPTTPLLRSSPANGRSSARLAQQGRFVLVPGTDHVARLWDLASLAPALPPLGIDAQSARYSPDGKRAVVVHGSGGFRLWDVQTAQPLTPRLLPHLHFHGAAFSPDGRRIAFTCHNWLVRIWDTDTGRLLEPALVHDAYVNHILFDHSGERVITVTASRHDLASVHVWNVRDGKLRWKWNVNAPRLDVELSPDGRHVAVAYSDSVRLWDLESGQPVTPVLPHEYWVHTPRFDPRGGRIITGGGDSRLRFWKLPAGRESLTIRHPGPVFTLAVSPDGLLVATGDRSDGVRIWNADTGALLVQTFLPGHDIVELRFSPAGRWLLASSTSGAVQAWDVRTGEPLGPGWHPGNTNNVAAFRKDGRQLLMNHKDGLVHLLDFTADELPAEDWLLLATVQAGGRADKNGSELRLAPQEAIAAWDHLKERVPAATRVPSALVRSWYLAEGTRRFVAGSPRDAVAVLGHGLREFADDAELKCKAAIAGMSEKEGQAEFQQLAKHYPAIVADAAHAFIHLGDILITQKKYAEAAAAYDVVHRIDSGNALAVYGQGLVLYQQQPPQLPQAQAAFQKAVALDANLALAHYYLGRAFHDQHKPTEAAAAYQQAVAIEPTLVDAHAQLGYILHTLRKLPEALAAQEKALALHPQYVTALAGKGNGLRDLRKFPEAEDAYRRAGQLDPNYYDAFNGLGSALWDQKRWPEAEVAFKKAIELNPELPNAYNGLGDVRFAQKKHAEAQAAFDKAIAVDPKFSWAYVGRGNLACAQQQFTEAIAWYKKAMIADPDNGTAQSNLGDALCELKQFSEAENAFGKALALDSRAFGAMNGMGNVAYGQQKLTQAVAWYLKTLDVNPKYAVAHDNLAMVFFDQKKFPEALAAARKAVELDPQYAPAQNRLGTMLRLQKKYPEAEAALLKAAELDAKGTGAYLNLGNVYFDMKDFPRAIAAYHKGIAIEPRSAKAYSNLCWLYRRQGQLGDAIAAGRKAVEVDPNFAIAHNNLGLALLDQRKTADAMAAFHKALAIDPNYAPAHVNLGNALYAQRQLAEAEAAYRKAIALDPNIAEPHANLGLVFWEQGMLTEASAACRKAIELNPADPPAHNTLGNVLLAQNKLAEAADIYRQAIAVNSRFALAYNGLGNALFRQNKLGDALVALDKSIALEPTYAIPHNGRGVVLHRQWKLPEAIEAYKKAIQLDPNYALAHNNLGNVYRDQGRLPQAAAAYRKASAIAPKYVGAYQNLASVLQRQLLFAEAIDALQKVFDLQAPKDRAGIEAQLKATRSLLAVETKMARILAGKEPADGLELLQWVDHCKFHGNRQATVVRLYQEAFKLERSLIDHATHRYNAVCAAVLASAGLSDEAAMLSAAEKAGMRQQAYRWLHDHLQEIRVQLKTCSGKVLLETEGRLISWQGDFRLFSVRDLPRLAMLPSDEARSWRQLWTEVAEVIDTIQAETLTVAVRAGTLTDKDKARNHEIKLKAGVTYVIDMKSKDLDSYLKLLDEAGKVLAANDDFGGTLNARILFTPSADTAVRLVATSFQGRGRGTYTLTVRSARRDAK